MIFHTDDGVTLHQGDALDVARTLPAGAADCIVTSPPYFGLRDYGTAGQAAQQLGRRYVGIDISAEYLQLTMRERLGQAALGFDT